MEKYGEIPPKFTKKWWEHIWEYYKWRIMGTAFAVMLIVIFIVQCSTKPKYDMTVIYAGHKSYSDTEQQRLTELAEQYASDADGNGEVSVLFQPLVFLDTMGSEEYDYAVGTKVDLTFLDEGVYIYLMDETEAILYLQRGMLSDTFERAETFAPNSDAQTLAGIDDNIGYAVNLSSSALLRENDIYCDDLYLLVRVNNKTDEKSISSHDGAMKFARALAER